MNMKLKKVLNDIQKTEEKIAELQKHLKKQNDLKQQMEDIEIIKSFRSLKLDSRELLVLLDGIQKGTATIRLDEEGGIAIEDAREKKDGNKENNKGSDVQIPERENMKNKVVKKLMMIVMAATMLSGFSFATVYANADPPAEETTTEVVAETSSEATTEENTEDTGRVIAESDSSAFSTPGNAQLVDDKENDDTKQFLTIQTKKGNTFYMVIDRSSTSENVYMMSLVDENDLAEFLDETEDSKTEEEQKVVIPETTTETTPAVEKETEETTQKNTGSADIWKLCTIVLAGGLGIGAVVVYLKYGRKKEDGFVNEQLEFTDGPFINEEQENEDGQED